MAVFNCLNPITIHTKHGTHKVPCRKCAACLNRKGSELSTQCLIEQRQHKYTMFITLTYADDYLPVARVVRHDQRWVFVDASSRDCLGNLGVDGSVMSFAPLGDFDAQYFLDYYKKLNLSKEYYGFIPYLSRRDYQLFIKRLRKTISLEFPNEKIRYYVCGEYGPVHFRPHFHLLLFLDSQPLSTKIGEYVRSCWPYGFIDCQLATSSATGYVSKYINSNSRLSAIQRLSAFKPFSRHSVFFAQSFYKVSREAIEQKDFRGFTDRGITVNGKFKQVVPWLAYEANIFPKCYGFSKANRDVLEFCYTSYRRVSKELGLELVSSIVKELCSQYYRREETPISCAWFSEWLKVFDGYYDPRTLDSTLLSIFYLSRKFDRICDNYGISYKVLIGSIVEYYKQKDYQNLIKQYEEQHDFMEKYGYDYRQYIPFWYTNFEPIRQVVVDQWHIDVEFEKYRLSQPFFDHVDARKKLQFLYWNNPYDVFEPAVLNFLLSLELEPSFMLDTYVNIKGHPLYLFYATLQNKICNDSVKHKKLQDLNKIFCYGKHNDSKKCTK